VGMPALALADKLIGRAGKVGATVRADPALPEGASEEELGDRLLAIVAAASARGLDSERALRGALRRLREGITSVEEDAHRLAGG
jgi:XTP/dITP diphosphohydrolase